MIAYVIKLAPYHRRTGIRGRNRTCKLANHERALALALALAHYHLRTRARARKRTRCLYLCIRANSTCLLNCFIFS